MLCAFCPVGLCKLKKLFFGNSCRSWDEMKKTPARPVKKKEMKKGYAGASSEQRCQKRVLGNTLIKKWARA